MASASQRIVLEQAGEHRSGRRFPIRAALHYQVIAGHRVIQTGVGYSVNVSNSGVLFDAREPLPLGMQVKLSIDWPAQIDNKICLTFHVLGRIVRVSGGHTGVEILKHEFRTRSSRGAAGETRISERRHDELPLRLVASAT